MKTQDGGRPARDTGCEPSKGRPATGRAADQTAGRKPSEPQNLAAPPEPFRILESTADGRRVIAPCGELDLSTAAQLRERLADGRIDTVLDLSMLSFIDSTGIHLVASTAERAQSQGWEFTVRNPQPAVLRVITLVGLDRPLGLESQTEPEEALRRLGGAC